MTFDSLIRQFYLVIDSSPTENSAIKFLAWQLFELKRATLTFPRSVGEFVLINYGKIIECPERIVDSWIFLVYQELMIMLENELILVSCLQVQLNFTKSSKPYFSSLFFKGL